MREEERERILGATLNQLIQAKQDLSGYQIKARKLAEGLEATGQLLRGDLSGDLTGGGLVFHPTNRRLEQLQWPTLQDISDVVIETRRLTKLIAELEESLRGMGDQH